MPALYRTYRPRKFSEVVGQAAIVRTLRNAVAGGSPAHAYLFCGGRGLGKTTLARVLARTLNCLEQSNGEACLTCRTCQEMDAGAFLDLVEIDAASNTGVDNIRSLIETVRFQPVGGKYKIYIIDEAHMLSKGAWNALLKTLEEPPSHTVFVLATTEAGKVPATIHSRAQRFDFTRFSRPEITGQLEAVLKAEQRTLPPEVLDLVAQSAEGGMRDALTLLAQVLSVGDNVSADEARLLLGVTSEESLLGLLQLVADGKTESLPEFVDGLVAQYPDMLAFNRDLLELLRRLLAGLCTKAVPEPLAGLARHMSEHDCIFLVRQFLRSYKEIPASPQAELPLLIASLEAAFKFGRQAGAVVVPPAAAGQAAHHDSAAVQKSQSPAVSRPAASELVVAAANSSADRLQLEQQEVDRLWPDVCNALKSVNGPLSTLVRNSPVVLVEGNTVTLGVRYLFHKEQLESAKNRQLLSEAAARVFGGPVAVFARFIEREAAAASGSLQDALRVFSGELVE